MIWLLKRANFPSISCQWWTAGGLIYLWLLDVLSPAFPNAGRKMTDGAFKCNNINLNARCVHLFHFKATQPTHMLSISDECLIHHTLYRVCECQLGLKAVRFFKSLVIKPFLGELISACYVHCPMCGGFSWFETRPQTGILNLHYTILLAVVPRINSFTQTLSLKDTQL